MKQQTSTISPAGTSSSQIFTKEYYDNIWGDVHRHDYTQTLADQLIAKYHPKSVLDIGTGCGELVRVLREKGVDAWGLEVSEYAVANSCAPEFMRLGDVQDIPYGRKFDLVHSQGLWEYIPDEDVQQAISECRRVGKEQEHNYDTVGCDDPPEHQKLPLHTQEWWDNQWYPKILVGCPQHEIKEYAFEEWIDCVNKLDYPNYEVLVVDNSPTLDFYERWKDKVPMVHIEADQSENPNVRICQGMAVLQKKFLSEDFTYWFNLESDVIVPPNAIDILLKFDGDWIAHAYPNRGSKGLMQGIGLTLLNRPICEAVNFDNSGINGPDSWFWEQTMYDFRTTEVYGFMSVQHLGTGEGAQ